MDIIRVKSSVNESLGSMLDKVRVTVSRVCNGIDDMNRFGNNMLVVRAEISPRKLPILYSALRSIKVHVAEHPLPDVSALKEDIEYPIALVITSFADDTDKSVSLPMVPG